MWCSNKFGKIILIKLIKVKVACHNYDHFLSCTISTVLKITFLLPFKLIKARIFSKIWENKSIGNLISRSYYIIVKNWGIKDSQKKES